MEASEEKRKKYQEAINKIPPECLVYIDESGIELTICRDRGWGKKNEKLVGVLACNHKDEFQQSRTVFG